MAAVGQTEGRPAERTLFGHPIGLANLFGVELWDRDSCTIASRVLDQLLLRR